MQYTRFQYNDTEATITAKWEVGVRNYTLPLALLPFAAVILVEFLKFAGILSLPRLQLQPLHFAAAALYLLFILFVLYRIRSTAESLKKRALAVSFTGDTVVIKTGDTAVYVTRFEDIKQLDYGAHILRVQSDYGAYCIPWRLVPADFIGRFEAAETVAVRAWRWM